MGEITDSLLPINVSRDISLLSLPYRQLCEFIVASALVDTINITSSARAEERERERIRKHTEAYIVKSIESATTASN